MESIAPTALAQSWDNVGLLAGDHQAPVRRVLACIDLTAAVVEEAVRERIDLVLAYHPPIFKPISSLCAGSTGTDADLFRCIRNGIAIYATHTALDAGDGGTNDVIASLCGIKETEPVEYVDRPSVDQCKLVVFVPAAQLESVAEAMFTAGAGHIGDYSRCSYRTTGQGTFFGGETTSPTIGERGRMEYAEETRIETVVSSKALPAVVNAMIKAHPYEEPAFDIYPLKPHPVRGMGRIGRLPRVTTLSNLGRKLKRATQAACVRIVGPPDSRIDRAVIVVGAGVPHALARVARVTMASAPRGGSGDTIPPSESRSPISEEMGNAAPLWSPLQGGTVGGCGGREIVIITGEIRHHDALTIHRLGCTAIALGHWASERPVLAPLAERLRGYLPGVSVTVSNADDDPFRSV